MAKRDKLAMLREIHGEECDIEEIEGSNHLRVNGQRAYVLDPSRELTCRHELVADLAATGLKPAEISRLVKTNGSTKSDGGYYATLLRDPRIRQRARTELHDVVAASKEKLRSVVAKATSNICDAVNAGDVKESHFVLATQGINEKVPPVQANVNLNFGDWLSGITNTKQIHDITGNTESRTVHDDDSALPSATGRTLEIGANDD